MGDGVPHGPDDEVPSARRRRERVRRLRDQPRHHRSQAGRGPGPVPGPPARLGGPGRHRHRPRWADHLLEPRRRDPLRLGRGRGEGPRRRGDPRRAGGRAAGGRDHGPRAGRRGLVGRVPRPPPRRRDLPRLRDGHAGLQRPGPAGGDHRRLDGHHRAEGGRSGDPGQRGAVPPPGRRHAADRLGHPARPRRRVLQRAMVPVHRADRRGVLRPGRLEAARSTPTTSPAIMEASDRSHATGRAVRGRIPPEGPIRGLSLAPRPVGGGSDEEGRVVRRFGTTTDIDDRKRAERDARFLAEASASSGRDRGRGQHLAEGRPAWPCRSSPTGARWTWPTRAVSSAGWRSPTSTRRRWSWPTTSTAATRPTPTPPAASPG